MKIDIITIFPEFYEEFLKTSIVGRAINQKLVNINLVDLRNYAHNKHRNIDDTPYGGGAGMLQSFPPIYDALKDLGNEDTYKIYLSPQGKKLDQQKVIELASKKHLILISGHYEGVDARVLSIINEEISIGDYILTSGEIPAMIMVDSITRLIPNVIMDESKDEDSLQKGLLKYPQYTKPSSYEGYDVPEILLSGHHENIKKWRLKESIKQTYLKRPDLLKKYNMSNEEKKILEKIKKENADR